MVLALGLIENRELALSRSRMGLEPLVWRYKGDRATSMDPLRSSGTVGGNWVGRCVGTGWDMARVGLTGETVGDERIALDRATRPGARDSCAGGIESGSGGRG